MVRPAVGTRERFRRDNRALPALLAENVVYLVAVQTIWSCPCVQAPLGLDEESVGDCELIFLTELAGGTRCFARATL